MKASLRLRSRGEDGSGNVSYLQVHFWPGGTEEQYRAMIKVVHPETGLPVPTPAARQRAAT
jgi:hypothetical protein